MVQIPQTELTSGAWLWRLEALDAAPAQSPTKLVSWHAVDVYETSPAPTLFDTVMGSARSHAERATLPPSALGGPQREFLQTIQRLAAEEKAFNNLLSRALGPAFDSTASEALRGRTLLADTIWVARPDLLEGPYAAGGQALLTPPVAEGDLLPALDVEPNRLARIRLAVLDVFERQAAQRPDPESDLTAAYDKLRDFLRTFSLRVVTRDL